MILTSNLTSTVNTHETDSRADGRMWGEPDVTVVGGPEGEHLGSRTTAHTQVTIDGTTASQRSRTETHGKDPLLRQ